MPLSEHEQRLLEQIERSLVQDDPKFASTVRSTNPRTYLIRRVRRSALIFTLGLVLLVVGVGLNRSPLTVIFGIVGFALMLYAALRGATDLKRISGRATEPGPARGSLRGRGSRASRGPGRGSKQPRGRTPFIERVEERWRRRWEERGGM